MRVALLHLELNAAEPSDHLAMLEHAILAAAQAGAEWMITPEMALQGYFFARHGQLVQVKVQPEPALASICFLARRYEITIFLGCAEQCAQSGLLYNSCLVIGPQGRILGRHRKLRVHGDAEAWAARGSVLKPVQCRNIAAGILICADSWYAAHAITLSQQGADVIVVPAAWPPGKCGPGDCWEECSRRTGLPVWVCNQTGGSGVFDLSQAQSVVIEDGQTQLAYQGCPAILMFDWELHRRKLLSNGFTIRKLVDGCWR